MLPDTSSAQGIKIRCRCTFVYCENDDSTTLDKWWLLEWNGQYVESSSISLNTKSLPGVIHFRHVYKYYATHQLIKCLLLQNWNDTSYRPNYNQDPFNIISPEIACLHVCMHVHTHATIIVLQIVLSEFLKFSLERRNIQLCRVGYYGLPPYLYLRWITHPWWGTYIVFGPPTV